MKFRTTVALAASKFVRGSLRLLGKSAGALPGLVGERIAPNILADTLSDLPDGVIIVTGTNGKTTTTKIITDMLRLNGKRVLTNRMGSNFTRGVVSVIVAESELGKPLPHDVAVLELDEAYARKFVQICRPRYVVALNVMRDQLDRFGEIDTTARYIASAMHAAHEGVIVNADDPRLVAATEETKAEVIYFGVDAKLAPHFPHDDAMLAVDPYKPQPVKKKYKLAVALKDFRGQHVTYAFGRKTAKVTMRLTGQYNFQNGAAALALLQKLLPDITPETLVSQLSHILPAFGRGEVIEIDGQRIELILIKNPSGFRLALASFDKPAEALIAINDNDPDGRDVSWLWDVNFHVLGKSNVATSGTRGYDMALRLQYDGVPVAWAETDIKKAVDKLLATKSDLPKRIFCNYTAMLAIRSHFGKELHEV
jgi:UDP-N-acetylmuramyl tripeptide synthase